MAETTEKMRRMIPLELERIAFGVRYEPQLKLLDRVGAVMDEILRAEGTPFDPDRFPYNEATPMQYRLVNPQDNSELIVNGQDTILQMPLKTRDAAHVNELGESFEEYALGPLRKLGNVKNIVRYGLLLHFKEDKASNLKNPPVAHYLAPDFARANKLIMQFSQRLAVEEALAMKRIDDYRSVIYTVNQSESGSVRFSIDYQKYFQPLLDAGEWKDRPFSSFVNHGTVFIESEIQRWLKTFDTASEVA